MQIFIRINHKFLPKGIQIEDLPCLVSQLAPLTGKRPMELCTILCFNLSYTLITIQMATKHQLYVTSQYLDLLDMV